MSKRLLACAVVALCVAAVHLPAAQDQDDAKSRKTVRDPVYTAAQAERGRLVYEEHCVTCHLADLDGSANPTAGARGAPLVGTRFVQDFGESKVSALFNKMKRDMPSGRPGTLTDEQYLDVATYVLHRNRFPAGSAELTSDIADSVWIPGAGGGEGLQNYTFVSSVGCLHQDPTRSWLLTNAEELKKTEPSASATVDPAAAYEATRRVHVPPARCDQPQPRTAQRAQSARDRPHGATGCGNTRECHNASDGRRVVRQLTGLIVTSAAIWMVCVLYAAAAPSPGVQSPGVQSPEVQSPESKVQSLQTQTVWSGVYSEAQAYRGEKVADTTCIGCHGPKLDGGDSGPKLVGETFLANWSSQSVGELFNWLREAMPAEAPGTLSKDDAAAVIAYILKLNQMPAGKVDLSTEPEVLNRINIAADKP